MRALLLGGKGGVAKMLAVVVSGCSARVDTACRRAFGSLVASDMVSSLAERIMEMLDGLPGVNLVIAALPTGRHSANLLHHGKGSAKESRALPLIIRKGRAHFAFVEVKLDRD